MHNLFNLTLQDFVKFRYFLKTHEVAIEKMHEKTKALRVYKTTRTVLDDAAFLEACPRGTPFYEFWCARLEMKNFLDSFECPYGEIPRVFQKCLAGLSERGVSVTDLAKIPLKDFFDLILFCGEIYNGLQRDKN